MFPEHGYIISFYTAITVISWCILLSMGNQVIHSLQQLWFYLGEDRERKKDGSEKVDMTDRGDLWSCDQLCSQSNQPEFLLQFQKTNGFNFKGTRLLAHDENGFANKKNSDFPSRLERKCNQQSCNTEWESHTMTSQSLNLHANFLFNPVVNHLLEYTTMHVHVYYIKKTQCSILKFSDCPTASTACT